MLSRVARGEGIKCPHCKTFAPLGPGGDCICTSCGCKIERFEIGAPAGARPRQSTPRAKTTAPSGNLGVRRSALLEAAGVEQPDDGPEGGEEAG